MSLFVDGDVGLAVELDAVKQLNIPQEASQDEPTLRLVQNAGHLAHVHSFPQRLAHRVPITLVGFVHAYKAVTLLLSRDNDLHLARDLVVAAIQARGDELVAFAYGVTSKLVEHFFVAR